MITQIGRYFVGLPNIVGIVTDDNLATITTTGYLNDEADNIEALNNGEFQWEDTDLVLIHYSPGQIGFFVRDASNSTFVANPPAGGLANTLPNGNIFVGNALNVATGVPMSGDATIDNTGALTIANDAITTAKIDDAAVTVAKLEADLQPSHVVKFAGQHTTVGGGAAEAITVTGAAATDLAFVQMVDDGTNNVTIVDAVVTTDTLTVNFSANPGNDAVINYQLLRAV